MIELLYATRTPLVSRYCRAEAQLSLLSLEIPTPSMIFVTGVEPATSGLGVLRAIHCATRTGRSKAVEVEVLHERLELSTPSS